MWPWKRKRRDESKQKGFSPPPDSQLPRLEPPPGDPLLHTLSDHQGPVLAVAVSPDGNCAVSASRDKTLKVWNISSGTLINTLIEHTESVSGVAISPDGNCALSASFDTTLRVWNISSGTLINTLIGHTFTVYGVAISPDGKSAVSASRDKTLKVWNISSGKLINTLRGHTFAVSGVAISPDGNCAVSASDDKTLKVWNISSGTLINTLIGHTNYVWGVAISPDGNCAVSASYDMTLKVWNLHTGKLIRTLEGHTAEVLAVAISHDNQFVISGAADNTVRVWNLITGDSIAVLKGHTSAVWGVAVSRDGRYIVSGSGDITFQSSDNTVRVWDLPAILKNFAPAVRSVQYTNAKVVLVGDTGVGKTGLRLVLTGQNYTSTDSSHGRWVETLETKEVDLAHNLGEIRETLLWDLAGQPSYRIIHQLHLTETAVALVVFDARSETDPFAGVRHWNRAINQAKLVDHTANIPLRKYLVAARSDRGGIPVSKDRIDAIIRDLGFDGYFETSAKEGLRIPELSQALRSSINWVDMPKVNSNELFQKIKAFLVEEKKSGRLLSTGEELYRRFKEKNPEEKDGEDFRPEFDTCIGLVEARDLIRRLGYGDFVLLQPELLDAYASSMVQAAQREPDGLGFINEEDALAGRFQMSDDERIKDRNKEKLLLISTVEELLRHEIALKEITDGVSDLVFPSQFTRERPDAPEIPGKTVVFTFEGPLVNIYATLAVRLCHSSLFRKREMWKNAASYSARVGGECGIYLRELEEGKGELILFSDRTASEETKYNFENYVAAHLAKRAIPETVKRRRIFVCSGCGVTISDEQSQARLARGFNFLTCSVCETKVLLLDREELVAASVRAAAEKTVAEMDRSADKGRDLAADGAIMRGKIESGDYDVFLCYNSKDKPAVKKIGEELKKNGILPWLDDWELAPGSQWADELAKQIKKIKSVAVFVGPNGIGPWQDIEQKAFIRQFAERKCPVIPVILPGCKKLPELPLFMHEFTWLDISKTADDPIELLIWGITGQKRDRVGHSCRE